MERAVDHGSMAEARPVLSEGSTVEVVDHWSMAELQWAPEVR